MKTFLAILVTIVLTYLLAPFYIAAITAWMWLPIVFDLNNFFGGFWLGLVIGLVISIGGEILYDKFLGDN